MQLNSNLRKESGTILLLLFGYIVLEPQSIFLFDDSLAIGGRHMLSTHDKHKRFRSLLSGDGLHLTMGSSLQVHHW